MKRCANCFWRQFERATREGRVLSCGKDFKEHDPFDVCKEWRSRKRPSGIGEVWDER